VQPGALVDALNVVLHQALRLWERPVPGWLYTEAAAIAGSDRLKLAASGVHVEPWSRDAWRTLENLRH
jgi:hypothetical protein